MIGKVKDQLYWEAEEMVGWSMGVVKEGRGLTKAQRANGRGDEGMPGRREQGAKDEWITRDEEERVKEARRRERVSGVEDVKDKKRGDKNGVDSAGRGRGARGARRAEERDRKERERRERTGTEK